MASSAEDLKKSLEILHKDFQTIPDREKDFPSLQDRLEVLLQNASILEDTERAPLVPLLVEFQNFLKEHIELIQKEAALLQVDLVEKKTHKQATAAYKQFKA